LLRGALWDEQHYDLRGNNQHQHEHQHEHQHRNNHVVMDTIWNDSIVTTTNTAPKMSDSIPDATISTTVVTTNNNNNNNPDMMNVNHNRGLNDRYNNYNYNKYEPPYPKVFYPNIDLSIPDTVYSDHVDLVWDLLRWEAYQNQQQQHEPLLVSFLHSTILNHDSLESSLAFLLANRLQSPAMMISTQLQALILSALRECPDFRRKLRADMMAVRDRDPACHTLPDVFLYFKGFHALQSHRTAHVLWNTGRRVLAQYLQSQVSQIFQIDIHPNATIGSGIMLDHGTGIVIGETVRRDRLSKYAFYIYILSRVLTKIRFFVASHTHLAYTPTLSLTLPSPFLLFVGQRGT
jgi:Serine acetyltransferase, N-terminal